MTSVSNKRRIARSDKSMTLLTIKDYSTFCTVEADCTDRHEASRGLIATAELLVESVLMLFNQNYKN